MSISRPSGGRWRKAAIVVATSVAFLAPGLSGGPASAVVDQAAAACPDAFPVADLTTGMEISGLTVEKGTTPDPFTAKVVGVIENGIGPDVDMIIVDADSPALQRAGGIWAGMSGSPVYAPDGRLVGAVAYGLSNGPSKIAGVTPAADMKAVLSRPAAKLRPASKVALTPAIKQRLVKSGALTATQAAAGMRPLPTPLGVSGVNSAHMSKVAERLEKQAPGTRVYAAGAAPTGPVASPSDIFPGSNFAAAISYGDFSAVGVGTTTAVCSGDVALAFGHPFLFSGPSSMSVHPATAVYVQADPVAAPFKVANPGGPVGTLDQDRLAAIRAKLGPLPASVPVTSKVTATDDGTSREATTQVNVPSFIPNVSALHMLQNLDRVLDRIGAGSSDIRWEVSGTRASGAPFSVDVHNLYASPDDVTSASVGDSADQLFAIANNSLEDAKITGVKYTGSVSNTFTQYSIKSVLVRLPSGQLVPAPTDQPLEVAAGSRLNVRVVLQPYRTPGTVRNVDLSVVVPAGTVGGQGMVDVVGGPGAADDPDAPAEEPASFDELLTQLRGLVPNNAVSATLDVFNDTPTGSVHKQTVARQFADKVVGGERAFPITVVPPRAALPGVVDGNVWKLRSNLSSGPATSTFTFGTSTDRQVMGDFDGSGSLTPAVFRNGTWFVRKDWSSAPPVTFQFGQAGDIPVVGDWDGDGRDTVGVFRSGHWFLRNSLSTGPSDVSFTYADGTWRPVVGDWDGDGVDTIGAFRNGSWTVRNSNSSGAPSATFTFGAAGDVPVAGEWNDDGRDGPGVYRAGRWQLRNGLSAGQPSLNFTFGGAASRPVVWG